MTTEPHDDEGPAFIVEGVEPDDGSRTTLQECATSGEAREWLRGYVRDGNAGNWDIIEAYDTRGEPPERFAVWTREEGEYSS